jgi:hypothetical protein
MYCDICNENLMSNKKPDSGYHFCLKNRAKWMESIIVKWLYCLLGLLTELCLD